MDETRVREALDQLAGDAPDAPALWDRTQQRITHRRRRRAALSAVAIVAVLAIGAGTVVAVTRDQNDNRVTAGPSVSAGALTEVLGVVDGRLVVMSAQDGSQTRDLAVPDANIAEVSTTPGAPWIVYTSPDARTEDCAGGPALVKARPDGSQAETVVGGGITRPLVSPNGAWVAYGRSECEIPWGVGVTNLVTGANFGMPSSAGENSAANWHPLAFTLDSTRLLWTDGRKGYMLSSIPDGSESELVPLTPGVEYAAFTSADELILAYRSEESDHDLLAQYNLRTGDTRELLELPGRGITSLSFDRASDVLLIATLDDTGLGELIQRTTLGIGTGIDVPGLTSAAWFAARSVDVSTTTTTAPVVNTATIVVPDLRGLPIGQAGATVDGLGLVAKVRQGTESVLWQEPPAGTARRAGQTVSLWACWPAADCVAGPQPDYINAFEPATDWRPIDFAGGFWAALGSPAARSPEELGAVVAAFVGDGSEVGKSSYAVSCAGCPTNELWVQVRNEPDDSVDGWDYRLFLRQTEAGWTIDRGEQRVICARGENVTDACP